MPADINIQQNKPVVKKSPAKEFFFHLLSTVLFFVCMIAGISLGFAFIEYFVPDPLSYYPLATYSAIHVSIAILTVAFPVYLIVQRTLIRDMQEDSDMKELRIRKWLLWFTFFAAAITLIIDGIIIIYNFLSGDLTLQFGLKLLLVASTALFSLFYVRAEIYGYFDNALSQRRTMAIMGVIKLIALIVIGFWITGGPSYQRALRTDNQTINDLQIITNNIASFYYDIGALPANSVELSQHIKTFTIDPAMEKLTAGEYAYLPRSSRSFDLCATFETGDNPDTISRPKPIYENYDWSHPAGDYCFKREVITPDEIKNQFPSIQ